MKKYLNILTISFATLLLSGCWSSSEPKVKVDNKVKKEVVKEAKASIKPQKESIKMPPESKLIDKIIEEKVIIDDTPSKQQIESVD